MSRSEEEAAAEDAAAASRGGKPDGPRFRRYSSETRGAMLVEAGLACLARGGITAFTIDNICREARTSRGLITHHFGTKDGLLAAIYATMYDRFTAAVVPQAGTAPGIVALIESNFAPEVFNRDSLKIWLALWGEIANKPELQEVHRRRYRDLLDLVGRAVAAEAQARGRAVDAPAVAMMFVALSDGMWLEQGIDPSMISRAAALDACYRFFEAFLGELPRP